MLPFSLPDSPSYAVAFSGGADSRLLLELTVRALLERFGEDGRKRVIALHLHHGIRGEEADRDEKGHADSFWAWALSNSAVSLTEAKSNNFYAQRRMKRIELLNPVPLVADIEKAAPEIVKQPVNDDSKVLKRGKSLRQINKMFGYDRADPKNW